MRIIKWPTSLRSQFTIWMSVLTAVALVAALGGAIAVYDVRRDIRSQLDAELVRLNSSAERSAAHIASQFSEDGASAGILVVKSSRWLRGYWRQTMARQPQRLYSAVVSLDGTIVSHTNRELEGKQIGRTDSRNRTDISGIPYLVTTDPALTEGARAIDVRVPIRQGEQVIGMYHAGLSADWLDEKLALERATRSRFWMWLVGGTCGMLLLSSAVVVNITKRTARLEHAIEAANARRVTEMHELVLGIAHEIRNPLNAIRLNLHTVGQVFRDATVLSHEEVGAMLDEMESEVARLETLMREMLGFTHKGNKNAARVEVTDEVLKTLTLLRSDLQQRRVDVRLDDDGSAGVVLMDATRLRQVLINLLNNAMEAMPEGGLIEVAVRSGRSHVELAVSDDGPGIKVEDRERVFVPFFSTKASGTGLGLALARKFIEEAGGTIRCEESPLRGGTCFRILLPAAGEAAVEALI